MTAPPLTSFKGFRAAQFTGCSLPTVAITPRDAHVSPAGFTLIELLVALAIASIAIMAALHAARQGIANTDELRSRLIAGWAAEDRLAEYRARELWPSTGVTRGTEVSNGLQLVWVEEVIPTANDRFRRVVITMSHPGSESTHLARRSAFLSRRDGGAG